MFTLPDLPYAANALEPFIDKETMSIHHGKHHATYVQNLNDLLKDEKDLLLLDVRSLVKDLDKVPEGIRTKVRNNAGGHLNHSLFWGWMSPDAGSEPEGRLMDAIKGSFGEFSSFKEKFTAAGMGRFGSGWVWLVNDSGKLAIVDSPNQDTPVMDGKTPILGLDVWEHAYYLKYQNKRADYINAWWNVVNWKEVGRGFGDSK